MPLGAFAPMPIRLGGTAEEGWISRDHARACADLVAIKRAAPLAVFSYTKSGATVVIRDYFGQNGSGSAYQPDSVVVVGTGEVTFKWTARTFKDNYLIEHPINVKAARVTAGNTASVRCVWTVVANGVTVKTINSAGSAVDSGASVRLF